MIKKDVFYYGIIKILTSIYWFAVLKISTVYLAPSSFGNFSIAINLSIYLSILLFGWQSTSALRFYHDVENKIDYYNIIFSTIIKNLIWFIGFGLLALFLSYLFLPIIFSYSIIYILPLSVFYGFFSIIIVLYRIKRELNNYLLFIIIQGGVLLFSVFIFVKYLGWFGVLLGFIVSYICSSLYFFLKKKDKLKILSTHNLSVNLKKEMIEYGIPIVLIGIISQLLSSSDQLILKLYGYDSDVGIYSANYNIAEKSIFAALTIFVSAFTPVLYKKAKNKSINIIKEINKGILPFFLISIPIILVFSIFSKDLSSIFLGAKYTSGNYIIPIIAFAGIFVGIASFYAEVLTVAKKTKLLALIYGFAFTFNIVTNLIFVKYFGIKAAVTTTFFSYFLLAITIYIISKNKIK